MDAIEVDVKHRSENRERDQLRRIVESRGGTWELPPPNPRDLVPSAKHRGSLVVAKPAPTVKYSGLLDSMMADAPQYHAVKSGWKSGSRHHQKQDLGLQLDMASILGVLDSVRDMTKRSGGEKFVDVNYLRKQLVGPDPDMYGQLSDARLDRALRALVRDGSVIAKTSGEKITHVSTDR